MRKRNWMRKMNRRHFQTQLHFWFSVFESLILFSRIFFLARSILRLYKHSAEQKYANALPGLASIIITRSVSAPAN